MPNKVITTLSLLTVIKGYHTLIDNIPRCTFLPVTYFFHTWKSAPFIPLHLPALYLLKYANQIGDACHLKAVSTACISKPNVKTTTEPRPFSLSGLLSLFE